MADLLAAGWRGSDYLEDSLDGSTVHVMKQGIDAFLAAAAPPSPPTAPIYVMANLGTNEISGAGGGGPSLPPEATWEGDYEYIIDAIHTKWPQCKFYMMKPDFRGSDPTKVASIHSWIDVIVAARPGIAFAGPNESVWLENGDNYATYTVDGTHYSPAGNSAAALQWKAALGL